MGRSARVVGLIGPDGRDEAVSRIRESTDGTTIAEHRALPARRWRRSLMFTMEESR